MWNLSYWTVTFPMTSSDFPRLRFMLNAWLHVRVINFRIIIIIIIINANFLKCKLLKQLCSTWQLQLMHNPSVTAEFLVSMNVSTTITRHRASTSMYSLTFRIRVTTPRCVDKIEQQARPFYRRRGESSPACVVCVCGMRAACGELEDYRWALPRIFIVLP